MGLDTEPMKRAVGVVHAHRICAGDIDTSNLPVLEVHACRERQPVGGQIQRGRALVRNPVRAVKILVFLLSEGGC